MFFPWLGLFDQMRMADVWVHYDDVQFSKGSFTNRVQIKGGNGIQWLSVPIEANSLKTEIQSCRTVAPQRWQPKMIRTLEHVYAGAQFRALMLDVATRGLSTGTDRLAELAIAGMEEVRIQLEIGEGCEFSRSSDLDISGSGTDRVLEVVKHYKGERYITGHGARNYLDHERFEREGISVEYLDYKIEPYPQKGDDFTPYVSALDAIAHCGPKAASHLASKTLSWREYVETPKAS